MIRPPSGPAVSRCCPPSQGPSNGAFASPRLIMTCSAILRRVVLAVTTQTRSHVVLYKWLRGRCLCHIAVTPGALHPRAHVRCMLEFHQGGWIKTVNPLPWNLTPRGGKRGNFLDFRIAGSDFGVTQHALGYRRNCRARAGVGAAVTIQALQSVLNVNLMRVGDRLFCSQRGRGHCDRDHQNRHKGAHIAGSGRSPCVRARVFEVWPFEPANTVVHELRAGNSHYQYWCLGAPALSGPNLSLTMLPHQQPKSAAPAT